MKNWGQQLIFAGYLIVMLLSSCSREDNVMDDVNGRPLVLSVTMQRFTDNVASGPQMRTAEDASGETIWSSGDQVAVKSGALTKTYVVDAAGKLTSSDPICWTSLSEIKTVNAWYPVTLPSIVDQSSDAKYEACNVVKADPITVSYYDSPTMVFRHQMVHLVIKFIDDTFGSTLTIDKLEILSAVQYTFTDGSLTVPANATQGNILADPTSTGYRVLLLPQTVPVNDYFMRITYGTKIYLYSVITPLVFEAGKTYNYTIRLPFNLF